MHKHIHRYTNTQTHTQHIHIQTHTHTYTHTHTQTHKYTQWYNYIYIIVEKPKYKNKHMNRQIKQKITNYHKGTSLKMGINFAASLLDVWGQTHRERLSWGCCSFNLITSFNWPWNSYWFSKTPQSFIHLGWEDTQFCGEHLLECFPLKSSNQKQTSHVSSIDNRVIKKTCLSEITWRSFVVMSWRYTYQMQTSFFPFFFAFL